MVFQEHPFWDFSVRVHQRAGVHEACLELQTEHALDVNVLFFCCWAGDCGAAELSREELGDALEAVRGWQAAVVRPVWAARWKLKPSFGSFPPEETESLRQALIQAELYAEHLEQMQLARALRLVTDEAAPAEARATRAAANLALYLEMFFAARPEPLPEAQSLAAPLAVLLGACFPEQSPDAIRDIILGRLP